MAPAMPTVTVEGRAMEVATAVGGAMAPERAAEMVVDCRGVEGTAAAKAAVMAADMGRPAEVRGRARALGRQKLGATVAATAAVTEQLGGTAWVKAEVAAVATERLGETGPL